MAAASADRNLLFGIIALQLDFVSRDELITGMNAWVLDKSLSLGDHLVKQGVLSADRLQMLTALVAEHVKQHGGDAQRSLAALSGVDATLMQRLAVVSDESVQQSIGLIGAARVETEAGATHPQPPASPTGIRYRILRPHARGGLGEVYVAEDTELGRSVALKEIQPRFAHDAVSRSRFVLEAEVTGGLEHPGIVPVYGLGTYADGRPFYAMRFIKGDNLKDAILKFHNAAPDFDSLAFRELLGRFIDVCNAVAYAHSRGVLHRDLKPGNVMLGKYGETLVVDWGLAKVATATERERSTPETEPDPTLMPRSGSASSFTIVGSAMGTPAYMPPEQAEGRLDLLGPASDVYSLGATLYELLTAKPPFAGSLHSVLENVQRGQFAPPRQVNGAVPRPLDAVCRKAMALKPAGRYSSALNLASELERWLADEPVEAWREPASVRARRWLRRHRGVATGSAITIVTALIALGVSTVLINGARVEAKQQRDIAELRFSQARQAVDDYLLHVADDEALKAPEMDETRKRLLTDALRYYEDFLAERKGDPALLRTYAAAKLRAAYAQQSLGAVDAARAAYDDAIPIYRDLVAANNADAALAVDLARAYRLLGDLQNANVEWRSQAVASYRQSLDLLEPMAGAKPDDPAVQSELAATYKSLGDAIKTGDPAEAIRVCRLAVEARKRNVDHRPEVADAKRQLADSLVDLAVVCAERREFTQALEAYQQARSLWREYGEKPASRDALSRQARVAHDTGFVQRQLGKPEALALFKEAIALQERIVYALGARHQKDLARYVNDLGDYLRSTNQAAAARPLFEQSNDLRRKLAAANPGSRLYVRELVEGLNNFGNFLRTIRQADEALATLKQGRDVLDGLPEESRREPEFGNLRALNLQTAGVVEFREKKLLNAAFRSLESARTIREDLVQRFPTNVQYRADLAAVFTLLGNVELERKPEDALPLYQKSCEHMEALARADEQDLNRIGDYAVAFHNLGIAQLKLNKLADAVTTFEKAIANQKRSFDRAPQIPRYRFALSLHYEKLAEAQQKLGHGAEVLKAAENNLTVASQPDQLVSTAKLLAACLAPEFRGDFNRDRAREVTIALLKKANDAGFKDAGRLEQREFDSVRKVPAFEEIVKKLKSPPAQP